MPRTGFKTLTGGVKASRCGSRWPVRLKNFQELKIASP
jgi:hypothetical protein